MEAFRARAVADRLGADESRLARGAGRFGLEMPAGLPHSRHKTLSVLQRFGALRARNIVIPERSGIGWRQRSA
jgi:hypothetical protein